MLLRFLAAYVIHNDPMWKEKVPVECECVRPTSVVRQAGLPP